MQMARTEETRSIKTVTMARARGIAAEGRKKGGGGSDFAERGREEEEGGCKENECAGKKELDWSNLSDPYFCLYHSIPLGHFALSRRKLLYFILLFRL